jgi:hypothetical protein
VRFPGDRLKQIRAGKLSVALRPFEKRPTQYKVDHYFSIERVDDVAKPFESLAPELQVKYPGAAAGDVVYVREVETLEEWIRIAARERMWLTEPPRGAQGEFAIVGDDVARAAGYESADELVDVFRTDFGGGTDQLVWVFDFVYAEGVHLLRGLRNEPEAVDPETIERFVVENRQGDVVRHEKRRARHERRGLRERVADLEALQDGGANLGRHIARIRDAVEAAEREARRRAA